MKRYRVECKGVVEMNREIKFRGLARYNSRSTKWIYGLPAYYKDEIYGIQTKYGTTIHVNPSTIGQYIGLEDESGREIYEGDIVAGDNIADNINFSYKGKVVFYNRSDMHGYHIEDSEGGAWGIEQIAANISLNHISGKILGNIYENPELLEGEK